MKPEIVVHPDLETLSRAAAGRFVELARRRISEAGRFAAALSGGSTPRRWYQLLGLPDFARQIEWAKVHLFQVDERCVPAAHPSSNFRMIREALLDAVNFPAVNFHRVGGELPPPEAANQYECELKAFFQAPAFPRFDLVCLGMGADGHTASLFPGSQTLKEAFRWAVVSEPGPDGLQRVTLTMPVLNNAARIIFLVTGAEKSETLARVLQGPGGAAKLPAELVAPRQGRLEWHLDAAAASKLRNASTA
jgi:6-phosphogluconolactonase